MFRVKPIASVASSRTNWTTVYFPRTGMRLGDEAFETFEPYVCGRYRAPEDIFCQTTKTNLPALNVHGCLDNRLI